MTKIRVLGVQIQPEIDNKQANFNKVEKFIEENAWYKPDLIVLPEVFNSGVDHRVLHKCAENIAHGTTTEFLSNLAKKYETNIVSGSFIEKCEDNSYKNSSVVFDRNGEIIGKYQKIHMFNYYGSNEGEYISSGDRAVVVQTDVGKIGLSICYDLRFPELYRALTYAGAQIIVCAAAWPYPRLDHWMTLNKARAIENTVYMIAVNQCGSIMSSSLPDRQSRSSGSSLPLCKVNPKRQNLGQSMLITPWGEVVASSGGDEGVFTGEIDYTYMAKIREEFPVLNDRNLSAYRV